MASGIKISDGCKNVYHQLHMKTHRTTKIHWAIFKFSDDIKSIVVDCYSQPEEVCDYDSVVARLPPDDVRYLVYDFEYIDNENCRKSEIFLVSWHPEACSIRKKMICASSFNALKAALSGRKQILEGDNFSDVDSRAALARVGGKSLPTN